jgi:hypothetical protein
MLQHIINIFPVMNILPVNHKLMITLINIIDIIAERV